MRAVVAGIRLASETLGRGAAMAGRQGGVHDPRLCARLAMLCLYILSLRKNALLIGTTLRIADPPVVRTAVSKENEGARRWIEPRG